MSKQAGVGRVKTGNISVDYILVQKQHIFHCVTFQLDMKGFSSLIKPSENNQYLLFLIFSVILITILRIKCLQVVITLMSTHDHLISDSWLSPPHIYDSDFIFLKYLTAL